MKSADALLLLATPTPDWMSDIEDWVAILTKFAAALAVGALAAALVVGLLLALSTRPKGIRRLYRGVPGLGGLMQPRIAMGTFASGADSDGPDAGGIQALIDNALQRLTSADKRVGLGRSTGTDSTADTIGQLGDLAPQFKALAGIVGFCTRVANLPRYTVNATLQPDGGGGVGLTLSLDRGRRAADATTLWQPKGSDEVGTFQLLAPVAAGWIDYAVRKDEGLDFDFVASPRSIAYFRAGVFMQSLAIGGEDIRALEAYEHAIREDGTNVGALLNLGRAREGRQEHHRAEALLKRALAAVAEERDRPPMPHAPDYVPAARVTFNPIWFQTMYSLAALHANAFVRSKQPHAQASARARARAYSESIIESATQTLAERPIGRHRELAKLLSETMVPGARAILATVVPNSGEELAALAARTDLSYRARFNIVCYYALPPRKNFVEALEQFSRAIDDAPFRPPQLERRLLAAYAWKDPWLEALRGDSDSRRKLEWLTAPYISREEPALKP